ncbi:uncharacterized protein LOC111083093 isoform X6 [Limulus polyphemus]|uniref:Uncharacterized protein LOC111083093 isoform X6 n=1 Tax=Limulus polyphemus TaxID=6850 RepID=A0ABM1RUK1_LIMPO|nr:uncharacterized protein LOC111083093 isoform X6 [Limulus polyphemus]
MEVRPFISVGGCFLIYLAIGTILTFGNLTPYLTSYLRQRVKKDITYEETSWIFYSYISTCSLLYFGGKLGSFIGRRWSMIVGSCILCFGIAVTYWSIQHSLVATIITYGVVDTLGLVCCFGHPVVTAVEEETISSELTNVYETSRRSCSKELSGPITKDLDYRTTINNDNLFESLEEDSANVNVDDEQPYSNGDVKLHVSPKEALKMKEFYLLSIVCICSYYPLMFVNIIYKTYGQTFIPDDTFLSTTGSVAGVVHALSRVIVGLIQDKLSYKLTSLLLLGVKTVFLVTMVATPYGGEVMYMIWICGLFATFPLVFVCIPVAVAEVFGTKYTAEIFGMVLFTSTASFFLWPLVLHRVTSSLGWFATFCVTATVSFIGILVTILFPETHRTQPLISSSFDGDKERTRYGAFEYNK